MGASTALRPLVVMGVSGSGKSTIGALLADALGLRFIDGDDLHPAANREKMRLGVPLDDDDRRPWLDRVGQVIADDHAAGDAVVVACSALKRRYRDALRAKDPAIVFVHLTGDTDVIAARIGRRQHEFMPVTLLASQLDALEPLQPDEAHVLADLALDPEAMVAAIVADLAALSSPRG
jgi:gluconokinase